MSFSFASSSAGRRDRQIDTLRGIACLLLVAFHVVGFDENLGLEIASGLVRDVNDILAHVRMPLFTFLSGIVYAWRPFAGDAGRFLRGKTRRLILPLLTVGTLFAAVQAWVPGTHDTVTDWSLLHILPVGHFWFLEALFLIFLLMMALEYLGLLATPQRFGIVFLVATLVSMRGIPVPWFAINGMAYLLPFFLAGMGIRRFGLARRLSRRTAMWMLAGLGLVFLAILLGLVDNPQRQSLPAILIGVLTCTALLQLEWQSSLLAGIGVFSYGIYLYHVFFTAGMRIVLTRLGVDDFAPHFLLGLTAGIVGPILLERWFRRYALGRMLLLGQSPESMSKPRPSGQRPFQDTKEITQTINISRKL